MKRFKLMASVAFAVAAAAAIFVVAAPAQASSDYSHAQYQITFSLNCDHASCQQMFGLGGVWGWIALTPNGGNAQVTECGHSGPGGGGAGAGHLSYDVTGWPIIHSATPIGPFVDPHGNYLVMSPNPAGLPPFPATYDHYSSRAFGSNAQVTIAP
jgi:hypothetical protein